MDKNIFEIAKKIEEGKIKCPCHLAVGQEAVPAVLAEFLSNEDRVYGTHRSHNQAVWKSDVASVVRQFPARRQRQAVQH